MAREFSKPFYNSKEWKNLREVILKRDNYICRICGRPAEEVHHIKFITPRSIDNPDVTMKEENLLSVCKDCHFKIHKEQKAANVARANKRRTRHRWILNKDGTYMDDNGVFQIRKVYLVYGAPCSGKTTFVQNHKEPHDIVIDLDAIIASLQGHDKRYIDNNVLFLAIDVRDFLYQLLSEKNKNFDCHNVWVIGSYPTKKEREAAAKKLGAELIYVDATQAECEGRARSLNRFDDEQYSIDIVNEWFRKFEK